MHFGNAQFLHDFSCARSLCLVCSLQIHFSCVLCVSLMVDPDGWLNPASSWAKLGPLPFESEFCQVPRPRGFSKPPLGDGVNEVAALSSPSPLRCKLESIPRLWAMRQLKTTMRHELCTDVLAVQNRKWHFISCNILQSAIYSCDLMRFLLALAFIPTIRLSRLQLSTNLSHGMSVLTIFTVALSSEDEAGNGTGTVSCSKFSPHVLWAFWESPLANKFQAWNSCQRTFTCVLDFLALLYSHTYVKLGNENRDQTK